MPNYPGKRKGTRRIVIWNRPEGEEKSKPKEWIITGTKADAETFEARKRIELGEQSRSEIRTVPLFSNFCVERYTPHAKRHLKAGTWERRHYQVATLIRHFGRMKINAITLADVERFKDVRLAEGLKAISGATSRTAANSASTSARVQACTRPRPRSGRRFHVSFGTGTPKDSA